MMLKQKFPLIREKVQYFRDLNPANLGKGEAWLYEMLKSLPIRIQRKELLEQLKDDADKLMELFQTHDDPAEGLEPLCHSRSLHFDTQATQYKGFDTSLRSYSTGAHLSHNLSAPQGYRVRGICLFGLAECARAKVATSFLGKGDMEAFGELITISHEGDRVTRIVDGKRVHHEEEITDEYLDRLISHLRSDDPIKRESARLYRQPGGYAVICFRR